MLTVGAVRRRSIRWRAEREERKHNVASSDVRSFRIAGMDFTESLLHHHSLELTREAKNFPSEVLRTLGENPGGIKRRASLDLSRIPRIVGRRGAFAGIRAWFKKRKQKGLSAYDKENSVNDDPALKNNPLRGKLEGFLVINFAIIFIFYQSCAYNRYIEGRWLVPFSENSMWGPAGSSLLDLGALNANRIRIYKEAYRIWWPVFMHSGIIHISINVISQFQYLYMFEPDWGTPRVVALFVVSGITGNLLSATCYPCGTTVGSSGGLFGLMSGCLVYCGEYWNTMESPLSTAIFTLLVLIISFVTGFAGASDNWAHLGGLLGGLLFSLMTLSNLEVFMGGRRKRGRKKFLNRVLMQRLLQSKYRSCRCDKRTWTVRLVALVGLLTMWIVLCVKVFSSTRYQPLGSLSWKAHSACCCCDAPVVDDNDLTTSIKWVCKLCTDLANDDDPSSITFGDYCAGVRTEGVWDTAGAEPDAAPDPGEITIQPFRVKGGPYRIW